MDLQLTKCTKSSGVRIVSLQFRFPSVKSLPRQLQRRLFIDRAVAPEQKPGSMIVEPSPLCLLAALPADLAKLGFRLVDAYYKERIEEASGKCFALATALFADAAFAWTTPDFDAVHDDLSTEFQQIMDRSLWSARGWLNEFTDKEGPTGQKSLNLLCSHRTSLFNEDGAPVTIKVPRPAGERGNTRVPLTPQDVIRLTAMEEQEVLSA